MRKQGVSIPLETMKLEFTLIKKRLKYEIANPTIKCVLNINNRSTRTRCEICSKLKIKTVK